MLLIRRLASHAQLARQAITHSARSCRRLVKTGLVSAFVRTRTGAWSACSFRGGPQRFEEMMRLHLRSSPR